MRDTQQDDLLERLQAGDDQALGDLADTYSARIYQLAFRYLRNKEDAEEVTQDVLFKVYRNIGTFRGDSALSSWIYRITFNTAMSRLRTARHEVSQDTERNIVSTDGEESSRVPREAADWTRPGGRADSESGTSPPRIPRDSGAARDLSRAGDAARHPGDVHGGGKRRAASQGSDAQVTPASRPFDPAQATGRLRRRSHAPQTLLRMLVGREGQEGRDA